MAIKLLFLQVLKYSVLFRKIEKKTCVYETGVGITWIIYNVTDNRPFLDKTFLEFNFSADKRKTNKRCLVSICVRENTFQNYFI